MRALLVAALLGVPVIPALAEDLIGTDEQVARLEICHDFGCEHQRTIYVFETEWQPVAAILAGATSAVEERARIAEAIGAMETLIGAVTDTGADRAGNGYPGNDATGQLDCIAESTNATRYLTLFEQRGLLAFHRVLEPAQRAPLLVDEHWAAAIEEHGSGRRFAVDSWPRDSGEPALVQSLELWRRRVE